jgi:hypothetical protein
MYCLLLGIMRQQNLITKSLAPLPRQVRPHGYTAGSEQSGTRSDWMELPLVSKDGDSINFFGQVVALAVNDCHGNETNSRCFASVLVRLQTPRER